MVEDVAVQHEAAREVLEAHYGSPPQIARQPDPNPDITVFKTDSPEEVAFKRAIKGMAVRFFVQLDDETPLLRQKPRLQKALSKAKFHGTDRPLFTLATALSLMVFFALCAQCAATLAVIRRETNSWRWPIFTFAYMTTLAYFGALLTYQIGIRILT